MWNFVNFCYSGDIFIPVLHALGNVLTGRKENQASFWQSPGAYTPPSGRIGGLHPSNLVLVTQVLHFTLAQICQWHTPNSFIWREKMSGRKKNTLFPPQYNFKRCLTQSSISDKNALATCCFKLTLAVTVFQTLSKNTTEGNKNWKHLLSVDTTCSFTLYYQGNVCTYQSFRGRQLHGMTLQASVLALLRGYCACLRTRLRVRVWLKWDGCVRFDLRCFVTLKSFIMLFQWDLVNFM